jgi:hypothetical protein
MRKSLVAAAAIVGCAAVSACGRGYDENPGPVISRSFPVGAFDQVEAAGPFDVTIHTGAAPSVEARGNQALVDRLEVDVQGGTLRIRSRNGSGSFHFGIRHEKADLYITVPSLKGATAAGSGDLTIDKVQGDSFDGKLRGSGDFSAGSVDVGSLKLSVAGSGDAVVHSGKAQSAEYGIAGSGDVDTGGITTQTLKVSVAGSGDVKAQATGTADINVMGSGDVTVTGGAKCTVSKAGSGDVHCS